MKELKRKHKELLEVWAELSQAITVLGYSVTAMEGKQALIDIRKKIGKELSEIETMVIRLEEK